MSNSISTAKETSFWNFIKENTVEIPIIQRDYAQGRMGKEKLRKNFLGDLKKALDNEKPYNDKALKLDFVYGSVEHGLMNPLDGQQRLTTLWLLHWYIALRAKTLNDEVCQVLKNFTYETRISSREFCHNLCRPAYFSRFDGNDIVGFITKQTWFYSAWKQDPTIQSMLRMLGGTEVVDQKGKDIVDGIEELFAETSDFGNYWEVLTSDSSPIVFYHLPLKDFGLSDDLYIKMNARGKQLTSFENFKADLVGYITEQAESELLDENTRNLWKKLLDPTDGIPIKLDTDWTDIFWNNKSCDYKIDEIYFAFFNRFFWNELFTAKDSKKNYILDIGRGDESSTQENNNSSYKYLNNSEHSNDYDTTIAFEGLDNYRYCEKTIPLSFFQKLQKILNNYFTYSQVEKLPECTWDNSFRFIPEYVKENDNNIEIENNAKEKILKVTTLNQVQRVVFFAVCKYYNHGDDVKDSESTLKQWMRVVWNLVSGEDSNGRPEIRSTSAMRTAMEFIDSLNPHKVYESLVEKIVSGNSSFDERCKEEIAKAKQILNEDGSLSDYDGSIEGFHTWEGIITDAEQKAFFRGSIRFLIRDEKGEIDWNYFDTKLSNAQEYFGKLGVKEFYRVPLTKALVLQCEDWENQILDKQIFNPNSATWNWILGAKIYTKPIHNILIADNLESVSVVEFKDANCKQFIKKNLLPFDEMILSTPTGRFKWHKDRLGFYKPYGQDAITFDWSNFNRNAVLTKLCDDGVIETSQRIGKTCFYRGWHIDFIYKGYTYQWYSNNHIYLIVEGNYCTRNKSGESEEARYYCFNAHSYDAEAIEERLNALLEQYQLNEKG